MLAGTHPRQRTIGAIVEDAGYHARLREWVRRYREDPSAVPPVREQTLQRAVRGYENQRDWPWLSGRLTELHISGQTPEQIAQVLEREGFRPPKRVERFNRGMVQRLLVRLGLARRRPHGDRSGLAEDEYRPSGLARRLGIALDTVRR